MRISNCFALVIFAFSICNSGHLFAQQKETAKPAVHTRSRAAAKPKPGSPLDTVIDTLYAAHAFEQTAISPNGEKLAWVETLVGKDGAPDGHTAIYLSGLQPNEVPTRVNTAVRGTRESINYLPHAEGSLAWSPDSTKLAFLSDAVKTGQLQLYVKDLSDHGSMRRLTNVKGLLAAPRWSPDGKTIAVLYTENATRAAGPLVAETPETGEIQDAFFEQRLALVDLATGDFRQISPADIYIYEHYCPVNASFANGN